MRLKGGQICRTNSFKARRVFETAPGPVLCRQKGPKGVPKWTQNGVPKRMHFQTFSCINLGHFWHLLGTQNESNSRHSNMAKTKVRTTCGNAKMMEKRMKNNIFEQFCNPGSRQKLAKRKQKRRSENKTEIVHVLDGFWHTLGALLGGQNGTKMETKTKTKLERPKGGSEGPKGGVSEMRRDPSMHSILLWYGNWNNWQQIANSTLSI